MRTASRVVSLASAFLGIIALALLLPSGGEARTEGIGMTLGILGFPLTFVAYALLDLLTREGTTGSVVVDAMVIAVCYFLQWQAIAYVLGRVARRRNATATDKPASGPPPVWRRVVNHVRREKVH